METILKSVSSRSLELIICENEYIQQINNQFRQKDVPTDVLSFPIDNEIVLKNLPLGTIIISINFVKEKSKQLGHTQFDEFCLLFIHGLLHLIGYDHECDNGEHRKEEEKLIKKFNLPKSLILRNSI